VSRSDGEDGVRSGPSRSGTTLAPGRPSPLPGGLHLPLRCGPNGAGCLDGPGSLDRQHHRRANHGCCHDRQATSWSQGHHPHGTTLHPRRSLSRIRTSKVCGELWSQSGAGTQCWIHRSVEGRGPVSNCGAKMVLAPNVGSTVRSRVGVRCRTVEPKWCRHAMLDPRFGRGSGRGGPRSGGSGVRRPDLLATGWSDKVRSSSRALLELPAVGSRHLGEVAGDGMTLPAIHQRRRLGLADLTGFPASRAETAARRGLEGTRDLAVQHNPAAGWCPGQGP
jgi:hypothetical protein